jgi:filamentous hemagglutinin family protein
MLSRAAHANPVGGTVTQGSATFSGPGPNLTITTSANAFINWQSFDIMAGESTTFVQPSASSVVWNQINSPGASQILGSLNANGYVILQNPNGFYVGGSASISTHGLVMTTASPSQTPDLGSGGAWQFNAGPPLAQIINYGTISVDKNSSAFLIANDVENHGTISAPQGNIGLYAGQSVMVSTRPDGRGLSARVTLPAGSVGNDGKLVADGGKIVMQAQVVNQGGIVQANSAANVNGVIELVASDSLNLGPGSTISATGDGTTGDPSPGGFVVLKSGGTYSDSATSTIDVSPANGGQGGLVEVFGSGVSQGTVLSAINNPYAVLYNPNNLTLSVGATATGSANPTLNLTALGNYGQIDLFANNNITLASSWALAPAAAPTAVSLTAGNNINLNTGSTLSAGNGWGVNFNAGNGVYLNGTATLQAIDGDINIYAGKEVQVGWTGKETPGVANSGTGSIFTKGGGSISVTAVSGDVNTGSNPNGYVFALNNYRVASTLGGISTAAGGDVNITAGGNVVSYLPALGGSLASFTAGTGAYGAQGGNVTVTAGGSVFGNYVEANGTGTITAENGNVGSLTPPPKTDPNPNDFNSTFALNLIKGSWDVEAPNGSIYLQEVRNPNGVFNGVGGKATHLFDYDPMASVSLNAANAVAITGGKNMPRLSAEPVPVPIVLPPTLEVTAGAGGFTLYSSVTLFQSPYGNVNITTLNGGSFIGVPSASGVNPQFFMSDSPNPQWNAGNNPLSANGGNGPQHASTPVEFNNPNPVVINVSGNLNNVDIYTTKATEITVGGNMNNSSFIGENLHPADVSFVNVAGSIFYSPFYSFESLNQGINSIPFGQDNPNTTPTWDNIFSLLVDPYIAQNLVIPASVTPGDLANYVGYLQGLAIQQFQGSPGGNSIWAFTGNNPNPGFVYNSSTLRLGFGGPMSAAWRDWLNGWNGTYDNSGNKVFNTTMVNGVNYGQLYVLQFNPTTGLPVVDSSGHLQIAPVTFASQSAINSLYTASLSTVSQPAPGIQIGGPGKLEVNAGSLSLGDSQGIESWGVVGPLLSSSAVSPNFNPLAGITAVGASVDVNVAGNIDMLTSRIASMFGGALSVMAGGSMDLGTTEVPPGLNANAYGVYTTGGSDVKVVAGGDINIDGSRIATFNGGNVYVESENGNVNVGSGGNTTVTVPLVSLVNLPGYSPLGAGNYYLGYPVYGSGIVATSLPQNIDPSGKVLPGNITVETPKGNISASDAGILQYALDGSTTGGPTITLSAGTPAVTDGSGNIITPAIPGNIDLGHSGIIGGTVDIAAQGNISGVIISRQDSTISSAGNFSGTLLSGGVAGVSAGGSVSGTVVGIGGVNASGGGGVNAVVLGQNVSVNGGAATSTLGSSSTATASSQSATGQASDSSKQQVASNGNSDQDDKNKKKGQGAGLAKRSSRVTVIVPKGT